MIIVLALIVVLILVVREARESYGAAPAPAENRVGKASMFFGDNYKATQPNTPIIFQSFDQIGKSGLTMRSWRGLEADIPYLRNFFTAIWLPPPSSSTANPGYLPTSMGDLNSAHGSAADFQSLVRALTRANLAPIVDVVFHHLTGADIWWKHPDISYLNQDDYASVWMWDKFNNEESARVTDDAGSSRPCFVQIGPDKEWKIKRACIESPSKADCGLVAPMYSINKAYMDEGNMQALNLCNLDVLRVQISFLHSLTSQGVRGFRFDQANGIPPAMFQLYNNSDVLKTRDILKRIAAHCRAARVYPQCEDLYARQIEEKNRAPHGRRVGRVHGPAARLLGRGVLHVLYRGK